MRDPFISNPKGVDMGMVMAVILALLVLSRIVFGQMAPPTMSVKKRHGQTATIRWNYSGSWPGGALLYFSVKASSNLNASPVEFKQVPAAERQTSFVVQYDPSSPRSMFYVVQAVYDGQTRESLPSNTVEAERIGPPPQ